MRKRPRYILNVYNELYLFFVKDDAEDLQLWDLRVVPPDLRLPESMIETHELVLPQIVAKSEPPVLELPSAVR